MPFDKQIPVSGEGAGSRFLLLTALAVAASLEGWGCACSLPIRARQ